MRSSFSRRRLASQHSLSRSGRASCGHWPGPLRRSPPLVAITRPSGYGWSASAIRFSLTSGPYESAVSIRFTPSSTTRRSSALAASGSSGGPQMPSPVMRMAPKPSRRTSRSPPIVKVEVMRQRLRASKALAQRLGPLAEEGHVTELDLLVATDHVGQLEQLQRGGVTLRRQLGEHLGHHLLVLVDQLALDPAHARVAERVELGPTQAAHPVEALERRDEPAAELELALQPHRPQQRRVEVEGDLGVFAELRAQLGLL